MQGYIIVIEGTDGCGKQTQAKLLYEKLSNDGYKVKMQSFPNYESPSSAPVKMYLGGEFGDINSLNAYQASTLYAVDRLCTYKKDLEEFYNNGGILILDRYTQSNMIHQACKMVDLNKRDNLLNWLNDFEFNVLNLPEPDKVIFLDVPTNVSLKLIKERGIHKTGTKKDIHEQDPNHLTNAYDAGKYVSKKFKWDVIECTFNEYMLSVNDIADKIYTKVKCLIKGGANG